MKIKHPLANFIALFLLVFVVTAVITYLWNLIFYATGAVDWGTSFALAIILAIALTWVRARERQQ